MLREDHKAIKRLFREYEAAGPNAHVAKGDMVAKMIELLTVHTYIENQVMYPRVRELVPDVASDIPESYEEHHVADLPCTELAAMAPDAERFDAKTTVLIESVEHHIEEEESGWFPKAPHHPAQPSALKKALDAVPR